MTDATAHAAGRFPAGEGARAHWAARCLAAFTEQRDRWALWTPVLFGTGIGAYFALTFEPAREAGAVAVAACAAAGLVAWRAPGWRLAFFACGLVAAGFALAQWRTQAAAAPVLARDFGPGWASGRVIEVDRLPEGRARVLLDRVLLQGVPAEATPARVRVRLLPGDVAEIGAAVRLRAQLSQPMAPALPGGYDFQRDAWFARIGGVGFAVGKAEPALRLGEGGDTAGALWFARVGLAIADRIRAALPGPVGELAAAFLIGDRSAIPRDVIDAMRDSGLAHLIAISGLNMSLAAGILFFGVRMVLTLIEPAALRLPVKKIAAGCAFVAALAYLLLSGATVPTQRSFIMTGLVLVAVMVDRTALTLRLLAWAAMLVLLIAPESLIGPSFQMSFAAVLALIALYEALRLPMQRWRSGGGFGRRAALYFAGLAISTLVAGGASGVIALHHFGRMTQYGLVANLVAIPVTAFWIMPWGVAAVLLMPFGLESLALQPMAYGIDAILATARMVASWPGAAVQLPPMPAWGLALAAFGGLWLCLWQGRLRWAGLAGILAGLATIGLTDHPDILINGNGRLIAVRMADGRYSLSSTRAERFSARVWLERVGDTAARPWPDTVSADGAMSCDLAGCILSIRGRTVALVQDPRALAEDCVPGAIVVIAVPARRACRAADRVIDRFDLWRNGAYALWLRRDGVEALSVRAARGDRLWTHGPPARHETRQNARSDTAQDTHRDGAGGTGRAPPRAAAGDPGDDLSGDLSIAASAPRGGPAP